jgi:hypothetical protein
VYCPLDEIVPAPLFASPPLTFHVTLAALPLESFAENCSTDTPEELVALQPVQLVSTETVPGEIVNVPFEGLAVKDAPPHPASTHNAGTIAIASARPVTLQRRAERSRAFPRFIPRSRLSIAWCGFSIRTPDSFL